MVYRYGGADNDICPDNCNDNVSVPGRYAVLQPSTLFAELSKTSNMTAQIYNNVFSYTVWVFGIALIGLGAILVVWILARIRRSRT